MRQIHIVLCCLLIANQSLAQDLYRASDFTREEIFTENIEGPIMTPSGLLVVNLEKDGTIGRVSPTGDVSLYATLPAGSIGNALMVDSKKNILVADWSGHNILKIAPDKTITTLCYRDDFNQPNDITINKSDQLFASDPNWKESTGKLWRIDPDGNAVLLKENMGTTNGIELSPDEKILYVNESVQRKIWKFTLDSSGNISNQQLFFQFGDFGLDGMKCDRKGNLYVTRHGKGTVVIISPTGTLLREVALKGKKPSNLVFGGKGGKTCFVTLQDRRCLEMFRTNTPGRVWRPSQK